MVHVIHRLNVGGLENGLVNLINHMPEERMHHAVICLTDYSDFSNRIRRRDVPLFALHKPAGNSPRTMYRLWKLLRKLRPDILHTRNLGALEGSLAGALAGVRSRIHGEHGRDSSDLDGNNVRHQVVRRLFKPFVHRQIALSKDLEHYLEDKVRVPHERIVQLYNGVDTMLFHPPAMGRETLDGIAFAPDDFVIGTIGRMHPVKDQLTLARAFVAMHRLAPDLAARLKLVMVGEGPLRAPVAEVLRQAGLDNAAWLPGERDDVPRIMRGLDLFVLPSLAEGISNTILEAMATGLPVVATAVGGNPELLDDARTGTLVPRADPEAMAQAMLRYATDPLERRRQGLAARARVESEFSMNSMVNAYLGLYEQMLSEGKI
ncbi:MAG: TIGR03088 family PEP-CTERM/XrtA system glycosyltransferase [Casimicrobiaceae bacterium]